MSQMSVPIPLVVHQPETVRIEPARGWSTLNLKELWEHRELLLLFAWRDLKGSYAQTWLGASWIVIKPLVLMAIFTIVFGLFVRVPSGGIPYSIFVFAGLIPWQFFARSFSGVGTSLSANQHLISKVYFPRLLLPLSALVGPAVEVVIMAFVLLAMMWYYRISPTGTVWVMPMLVMIAAGTALGAGLWLSALSVRYRDISHAHQFITQVWFFSTPVVYPEELVPEDWLWLYRMNPMTEVVEGVRSVLLGVGQISWTTAIYPVLVAALLLVSGLYLFRLVDREYVDAV